MQFVENLTYMSISMVQYHKIIYLHKFIRHHYVYTVTGVCVKQVLKGYFTGVVRHQNRYYAAEAGTTTIYVYEHTGEWKQCHLFPVNAIHGYTLTLGISTKLLFVGLAGNHRIDIFSLNGRLQSNTGFQGIGGPGQLNLPYICSIDAAGAALIADNGNDRLQLLSANGQWSIVQLQPHVNRPQSACVMNDTLYVTEWSNRLLHAYKMEWYILIILVTNEDICYEKIHIVKKNQISFYHFWLALIS